MKNKLLLLIVAILLAITLILGAAFLLWNMMDKKSSNSTDPTQQVTESVKLKKLSASQVKALSIEVKEVTTNLADKDHIVRASFMFQLDNKKALDEFEKLDFKVKNIIIQTLADMTSEQIKGSKGQDALKASLINKINQNVLTEGKLTDVSLIDYIVQ